MGIYGLKILRIGYSYGSIRDEDVSSFSDLYRVSVRTDGGVKDFRVPRQLHSPLHNSIWKPDSLNFAECSGCGDHLIPRENCVCGIHTWGSFKQVNFGYCPSNAYLHSYLCLIEHSGKVVIHEKGIRSSEAKIASFVIKANITCTFTWLKKSLERHGEGYWDAVAANTAWNLPTYTYAELVDLLIKSYAETIPVNWAGVDEYDIWSKDTSS